MPKNWPSQTIEFKIFGFSRKYKCWELIYPSPKTISTPVPKNFIDKIFGWQRYSRQRIDEAVVKQQDAIDLARRIWNTTYGKYTKVAVVEKYRWQYIRRKHSLGK